ncbi:MAG: CHASE2 domain-containing protein [Bacteroidia bacterium]|nr:CHASE2 domain-containing protein [Bacteroidia bacterium]
MRTSLLRYLFRLEYVLASALVLVLVWCMIVISDNLPETDDTSFLNPIFDRIDFLNIADVSLDAVFAVRDAEFPDPRIKVVNLGEVAPTPDGKIAMLLYKLHASGARVIGLDVFLDALHVERFPEERLSEFDALVQALRDVPNVVVVSGFDKESMEPEIELHPLVLEADPAQGFANLWPDADGVVRRFLPRATVAGEEWYGLPVRMLQLYDSGLVSKLLRLPAEPQIIYYTGTYHQFESVPIDDVVFGTMYDDEYFRDAIVLIGFVNEGGLFYLGDTHKTPMGKKIEVEGPDMPGVLIHANVINMLLRDRFIVPVPEWVDWLLVFVLSYLSLALYRVLRTKARNRFHVGLLISTMLLTEAVMVFFLPLIAFFYFDLKISYNLMATGALLFIPAGAAVTKMQYHLERRRFARSIGIGKEGMPAVLREAFADDEPFVSNIRLLHACLCGVQFAWACENLRRIQADGTAPATMLPGLEAWREAIPAVRSVFTGRDSRSLSRQYFFRYLAGKKEEYLRESYVKQLFFTTELSTFNPFLAFEEWELLLPHARRLMLVQLHEVLQQPLYAVTAQGVLHVQGRKIPESEQGKIRELPEGLYCTMQSDAASFISLSPLCEWTECKVHRKAELFIFAALVPRQRMLATLPVYYGFGPACEPVLAEPTMVKLRELEQRLHLHTTDRDRS